MDHDSHPTPPSASDDESTPTVVNTQSTVFSPPTLPSVEETPHVAPIATSPPTPPPTPSGNESVAALMPQPVIQVFSPRGVEYVFMTIALFTGAAGLISALIALVNSKTSFSSLAVPAALLVIAVPVFALLFLRLKKAELADPTQKLDASKRRCTQIIQIVSFVLCFFTLIGLVGIIFAKLGGQYKSSLVKPILDVLVVIVVAGGILFYYWRDEHKKRA